MSVHSRRPHTRFVLVAPLALAIAAILAPAAVAAPTPA